VSIVVTREQPRNFFSFGTDAQTAKQCIPNIECSAMVSAVRSKIGRNNDDSEMKPGPLFGTSTGEADSLCSLRCVSFSLWHTLTFMGFPDLQQIQGFVQHMLSARYTH